MLNHRHFKNLENFYSRNPYIFSFLFISFALCLNTLYNSLSAQWSLPWQHSTFLISPVERFFDFFTYFFSFPNSEAYKIGSSALIHPSQLDGYLKNNSFESGLLLSSGKPIILQTPLNALIALPISNIMQKFNVMHVYLTLLFFCFFIILSMLDEFSRFSKMVKILSFVISYPFLLNIFKGNIFITINLIFIIMAFYAAFYKKNLFYSSLFLSISININPLSGSLTLLYLVFNKINFIKSSLLTIFLSVLIFLLSYLVITSYVENYNLSNFLLSLKWFYINLLNINSFIASTSMTSFFQTIGFNFNIEIYLMIIFLNIFFSITLIFGFIKSKIPTDIYVFGVFILFSLVSFLFPNDYLLLFWIPLIFIINNFGNDGFNRIRFLCSLVILFVLSPKVYIVLGENFQNFANGLIFTLIAIKIIKLAYTKKENISQ